MAAAFSLVLFVSNIAFMAAMPIMARALDRKETNHGHRRTDECPPF
jgi:hypothetical protein